MIYANSYYFIGDDGGRCFDSNREYVIESNDWSHLIGSKRYSLPSKTPDVEVDKDVTCFITSFSTGLHAYVGILSILNNYTKQKISNKTIIVSEDLQDGILELIKYILKPNEVIVLKKDCLYKFKSINLIPNCLHSYFEDTSIRDEIVEMINKEVDQKEITPLNRLAILKHPGSGVASTMGAVDLEEVTSFCKRQKYTRIEPSEIGELNTINTIRSASSIAFSWGTTFMKNFIYISDSCKKIDVFIHGPQFENEYNHCSQRKILPQKYNNAELVYHLNPDLKTLEL
jgi:hypothetical protein